MYSVIIPTFGRTRFMKECIISVINQTLRPAEVIIVDDHSKCFEEKLQIVNSLKLQTDVTLNFKTNSKNLGACISRNIGADLSRTPFIAFLDDDDKWVETKAATQVPLLYKDFDMACSNAFLLKENKIIGETAFKLNNNLKRQILNENFICSPTNLINRNLFYRVGKFDETFPALQDRDLWTRMILAGAKLFLSAEKLAFYRTHSGPSIGKSNNAKKSYFMFLRKYKMDLLRHFAMRGTIHLLRNAFKKN